MAAHLHRDVPVRWITAHCIDFAFFEQRQTETFRIGRLAAAIDPRNVFFRIDAEVAHHHLGVHARTAFEITGDLFAFEIRNIFDVGLGDEDVRRAVGDGHDIDFAVDVIALFQHRAKRRRAAGRLEYDRAVLAPLMARVLAVGNALDWS